MRFLILVHFSGPRFASDIQGGSAMARFASARHADEISFRPNPCKYAHFEAFHASGALAWIFGAEGARECQGEIRLGASCRWELVPSKSMQGDRISQRCGPRQSSETIRVALWRPVTGGGPKTRRRLRRKAQFEWIPRIPNKLPTEARQTAQAWRLRAEQALLKISVCRNGRILIVWCVWAIAP